jgi:ribosomal protein S1
VSSDSDALECGRVLEGHVQERAKGEAVTLTFVPRHRGLGLRLDLPRLSIEEARAKYEIGSTAQMVVTGVHDGGGSAWLEARDGTGARVTKDEADENGVSDLRAALSVGDEVVAVVRDITKHKGQVQLQVALPQASEPTVDEIRARHPADTPLTMRVTGIAADGGRAWLVTSDGLGAMALRKDAGAAGVADLNAALARGDDVETRVLSVGEHNGKVQIAVALPSLSGPTRAEAIASLRHQLEALRIVPGEIHEGVVANVVEFGIFVALGPVSGLVHKTRVSRDRRRSDLHSLEDPSADG